MANTVRVFAMIHTVDLLTVRGQRLGPNLRYVRSDSDALYRKVIYYSLR